MNHPNSMSMHAQHVADARTIIQNEHMDEARAQERIQATHRTLKEHARHARLLRIKRSVLHFTLFFASFVFTTGFLVLAVLLWVRPDSSALLVLTGLLGAVVFVAVFALLRVHAVRYIILDTIHHDDTPPVTHHIAKSVVYGCIAFVFALLLAGLLARITSAFTLQ